MALLISIPVRSVVDSFRHLKTNAVQSQSSPLRGGTLIGNAARSGSPSSTTHKSFANAGRPGSGPVEVRDTLCFAFCWYKSQECAFQLLDLIASISIRRAGFLFRASISARCRLVTLVFGHDFILSSLGERLDYISPLILRTKQTAATNLPSGTNHFEACQHVRRSAPLTKRSCPVSRRRSSSSMMSSFRGGMRISPTAVIFGR